MVVINAGGEITYANAIAGVGFGGWIVGTKLNGIFPDFARSLAMVSGPSCMRLTTSHNEEYEALPNPIGGGSCGSFWPIAAPGAVQEVQQSDDLTRHALRTLS